MHCVVGALALALFAACSSHPQTPGEAQCPDARKPLSCSLDFSPEAQKIKANVNWLGIGGGVESEKVALQQIDAETQSYLFQSKKLCEEYNACVVDTETYATRTENLRRRMAGIPELYERVKNASSDDDRRKALAQSYTDVVPDDQRIELFLDFGVVAQRPGESSERPILQGEALPTDTRVRFVVRSSTKAHVYLFQQTPAGAFNVLFPDDRLSLGNPVVGGQIVAIPPGTARYRVNDKDIGVEKVYIAASLAPVQSLAEAVAKVNAGTADAATMLMLSSVQSQAPAGGCTTRALELVPGATPDGCVRSRGLELDTEAASKSAGYSFSARTEAADGTIVKVFTFNHTPG